MIRIIVANQKDHNWLLRSQICCQGPHFVNLIKPYENPPFLHTSRTRAGARRYELVGYKARREIARVEAIRALSQPLVKAYLARARG